MPEQKEIQSLSMPVLLLVVAIAGGILETRQPIATPRPDIPARAKEEDASSEKVTARLWEDPLTAIDRVATRSKISAKSIDSSESSLPKEIERKSAIDENQPTILVALVNGGAYAEDIESRIRARHALVSALSTSGFQSEEEDKLNCLTFDWRPQSNKPNDLLLASYSPSSKQPLERNEKAPAPNIAFEWWTKNEGNAKKSVLLLWVPHNELEHEPLARIASLVTYLGGEQSIRKGCYNILGPYGSAMLKDMIKEPPDPFKSLEGVKMFSWSSTVMDELLNVPPSKPSRSNIVDKLEKHWGLSFVNCVATDDQLCGELISELHLRGVDLADCDQHVVLIFESDTFYGRTLPVAFREEAAQQIHFKNEGAKMSASGRYYPVQGGSVLDFRDELFAEIGGGDWSDKEHFPDLKKNLHTYTYLRGIDGKGQEPTDRSEAKATPAPTTLSTSENTLRINKVEMNRAEGKNQLDYIPRLADELENLQKGIAAKRNAPYKTPEINAIGVIGSDFYDKLMILQALRGRFPRALFFTTDLDARFLDPSFLQFTRNLLVASSFGFTLNETLQDQIPPFRDNYTTSLYLAALKALKVPDAHPECRGDFQPFRFEIGRYHAINLSVPSGGERPTQDVNPPPFRESFSSWRIFWCAIVASTSFALLLRYSSWARSWLSSSRYASMTRELLLYSPDEIRDPSAVAASLPGNRRDDDAHTPDSGEVSAALNRLLLSSIEAAKTNEVASFPSKEVERMVGRASGSIQRTLRRIFFHFTGTDGLAETQWHRHWPLRAINRSDMYQGDLRALASARLESDRKLGDAVSPAFQRAELLHQHLFWSRTGAIVLAIFAVVVAIIIYAEHKNIYSQPFTLLEGISPWPPTCLRAAVLALSIVFIKRSLYHLRSNALSIGETYYLNIGSREVSIRQKALEEVYYPFKPPTSAARGWLALFMNQGSFDSAGWEWGKNAKKIDARDLWADYLWVSSDLCRFLRVFRSTVIYIIFGFAVMYATGLAPFRDFRGDFPRGLDYGVGLLAFILSTVLTFYVVDACRLCRRFIFNLVEKPTDWPPEIRSRITAEFGGVEPDGIGELLDIRVIAERTRCVAPLIYYPFILLSLFLVARSEFFNMVDWPLSVFLIFMCNAGWGLYSAILLQSAAARAKAISLKGLRQKLEVMRGEGRPRAQINRLERVIGEVAETREGAFTQYLEVPWVRAVLLPISGNGLIAIIDFLVGR